MDARSLKSTTTRPAVGGPKTFWEDQRAGDLKKKVANAEIYVIFEVFAFCGGRTKTDFKDREGPIKDPKCQKGPY